MGISRAMTVGILLTAGFVLAGCSAEPTDADGTTSPSPTVSSSVPSPSPTPTPGAEAEADEALLPIPVDDIKSWAAAAVPGSDSPGNGVSLSGWLSEHTSAHQNSTFQSLDPGTYQAQIACRGDGEITITGGELDGEGASDPVVCANETIAFDITTTRTGVQVLLDLEGDPSIYAFSLLRLS